jgi:hypothetical protein
MFYQVTFEHRGHLMSLTTQSAGRDAVARDYGSGFWSDQVEQGHQVFVPACQIRYIKEVHAESVEDLPQAVNY